MADNNHIAALRNELKELGINYKAISKVSGINYHSVAHIMRGARKPRPALIDACKELIESTKKLSE